MQQPSVNASPDDIVAIRAANMAALRAAGYRVGTFAEYQAWARAVAARTLRVTVITAPRPVGKHLRLDEDGRITKNADVPLASGTFSVRTVDGPQGLSDLIHSLSPHDCVTYGRPGPDAGTLVSIARAAAGTQLVAEFGGSTNDSPVVTRTRKDFAFTPFDAGVLLLDYDPPGGGAPLTPDAVLAALYTVVPALRNAPHVVLPSASAALWNADLGAWAKEHGGLRVLVPVQDGSDIPRALTALFERSWLVNIGTNTGYGRWDVSRAGSLLLRSIVDVAVGQPERIDFIGPALVEPPLQSRRLDGLQVLNADADYLDSIDAIPPLTKKERAEYNRRTSESKHAAESRAAPVRAAWEADCGAKAAAKAAAAGETDAGVLDSIARDAARRARAASGGLLPLDTVLTLHDGTEVTVATIVAAGNEYHLRRCADPLEPTTDLRVAFISTTGGRARVFSHLHGGRMFTIQRREHRVEVSQWRGIDLTTPECVAALVARGDIYRDGGEQSMLLKVRMGDNGCTARVVTNNALPLLLMQSAEFFCVTEKGHVRPVQAPPPVVVAAVLNADEQLQALPLLRGITDVPTMNANGDLLDTPGHDPVSGMLYLPRDAQPPVPIPNQPTREEAKAAFADLWLPFSQFPFAAAEDAGGCLTLALTAAVRATLRTAPVGLIAAGQAGTGKTLLTRTLAILRGGTEPAFAVLPRADDEQRKFVFALLLKMPAVLAFDNVQDGREIVSSVLEMVTTGGTFADRILSTSDTGAPSTATLILLNGNNITLRGPLARRAVQVHINARVAQPHLRSGFRFDPPTVMLKYRHALQRAALLLLRYGRQADMQGAEVPVVGSFEDWSALVLRAVQVAIRDLLPDDGSVRMAMPHTRMVNHSTAASADDSDEGSVTALLIALREAFGVGTPFTAEKIALRMDEARGTGAEKLRGMHAACEQRLNGATAQRQSLGMHGEYSKATEAAARAKELDGIIDLCSKLLPEYETNVVNATLRDAVCASLCDTDRERQEFERHPASATWLGHRLKKHTDVTAGALTLLRKMARLGAQYVVVEAGKDWPSGDPLPKITAEGS
jgi:hypothetical protein